MKMTLQDIIKLGKSPFERQIITIEMLSELLQQSDAPLILYGAGATCNDTLKCLFDKRIFPFCITDSDASKANTSILHFPVLSPKEAIQKAGPNAICVVAIWSASTFYKDFLDQLYALGYHNVYFLDIHFRPRSLDLHRIENVQQNETALLNVMDKLSDEISKKRFEDFIYAFLTSKMDHCSVLGHYKALDGEVLGNDLVRVRSNDILVHCRCGFQDDADSYLHTVSQLKEAYLFEPTWTGRTKTKEHIHAMNAHQVLVFPYLLSNEEMEMDFDEKLFFTRFIDQEEYRSVRASSIPLDMLAGEIHPTILHLDMTGGHIKALQGARKIISNNKPIILLSGFRLASEVVDIMKNFPQYSYSMRYFGGNTMRDGYVLIMKPNL
ncbi:hypothetical protein [Paenibacillus sp. 32352]|uniref:hypothetical protein n=1 Tax=Paenibacillus sp. 32352 TaxID=1969111 RepID=UPI0009ADDC3F|nr:hypothetical protein [Paenibacillus sp. 32352]